MEEIVEKINDLNRRSNTLEDNDQIDFEIAIQPHLKKIHQILDKMDEQIASRKISEEKYHQAQIDQKKQHIISKTLFPQYLILSEKINCLDNNELDTFNSLCS